MGTATAGIVSLNPADPADRIGTFVPGGGIDVDRAVTAAAAAAPRYAALPAQARADALHRVAARVEARAAELADLIRREVGKPVLEARGEVARTAAILRYHAQAALDPDGDTFPSGDGRSLLLARRRPRGVVGLITPWNFPIAIPAWKLGPALAYGNACVWKPSPFAPACAEVLLECLAPELPEAVVQLVQGNGDAGAALVGHRGVAAVSFTGSVATGASVARAAVERGAAAQCEMGGQNASIVLADADIEFAAATIAVAAMGYAGQKCTATSRVICADAVYAPMRDALAAAVAGLRVEDPADEACKVGPLISPQARDAAVAAVARGVEAGGRLVAGGSALDSAGNYLAPALVEVADATAELAQEEVFAPVCAVMRAADADAAVALANGVRHGLATAVFTRDLDRMLDLVNRIDTGLVRINQPTSGVDLHTPFGGEKASGLGPREQGKAAREFYTSLRTVLISPSC
ncbi:MAG TPA: aldehyde dehydrogenase family protein [Gaiellales bacterium]|jgi:aldehyde dehydrogenase (NAD+)